MIIDIPTYKAPFQGNWALNSVTLLVLWTSIMTILECGVIVLNFVHGPQSIWTIVCDFCWKSEF